MLPSLTIQSGWCSLVAVSVLLRAEDASPTASEMLLGLLPPIGSAGEGRSSSQRSLSMSVAAAYADGPASVIGSIRPGHGCRAVGRIGTQTRRSDNGMADLLSRSRCNFPAASADSLRRLAELSRTEVLSVFAAGCASDKRFFPDPFSNLND